MPLSGNKKRGTFYRVLIDVGSASGKGRRKNGLSPSAQPYPNVLLRHRTSSIARARLYERSAAAQEHRVYAAVIDREAVREVRGSRCIFAYETRLIALPTTQINVNRLRNIITRRRKKKSHYRTIEKSFI